MATKAEVEQARVAKLANEILAVALPHDEVTVGELNRAMHSLCVVIAHIIVNHTTNDTVDSVGMVAKSLREYCQDQRSIN